MEIKRGHGTTKFGPGISIELTSDEVASAIHAYLVSHNVYAFGPMTVTVNGCLIEDAKVYVSPPGYVIKDGKMFSGDLRDDPRNCTCSCNN